MFPEILTQVMWCSNAADFWRQHQLGTISCVAGSRVSKRLYTFELVVNTWQNTWHQDSPGNQEVETEVVPFTLPPLTRQCIFASCSHDCMLGWHRGHSYKGKKVLSDRDTAMTPLVVTFCHLATLHSSGLWRNRQRRTLQCQLMWLVLTPKGNLNNYSTTESRSLWNTDSVWEHFSALRLRTEGNNHRMSLQTNTARVNMSPSRLQSCLVRTKGP